MRADTGVLQRVWDNSLAYGATIDNGSPRLFYALNELCLVLDAARRADDDQIRRDVGQVLNGVLRKTTLGDDAASPFERDLQPTAGLVRHLTERRLDQLLQPLGRAQTADKAEKTAITLAAPAGSELPSLTLAFYGVALDDLEPATALPGLRDLDGGKRDQVARQQALCQLINLLNLPLLNTPWAKERYAEERQVLDRLGVVAATPNWGFAAQQHFCPSPGALPVPVAPDALRREAAAASLAGGRWRFDFQLQGEPTEGAGEEVIVAILDTCPTQHELDQARANPDFAANALLLDALGTADEALSLDTATLDALDGSFRMNLRQHNDDASIADLTLADHGIFIAGIVRDIAPQAEVHLGRVLNGYGVSTLRGVVAALDKLTERFPETFGRAQGDGQRLIVNLSLGASLPPGEELLLRWLPNVTTAVAEQAGRDSATHNRLSRAREVVETLSAIGYHEERRYLELLRGSVAAILGWVSAHPRVLVVAAAGNDKGLLAPVLSDFTRPEPRWPAQYDVSQDKLVARSRAQVIGVAAVNLADDGTAYSNRGDVPPLGNGVAVWGGEADHVAASDLGSIAFPPAPFLPSSVDAIKGVFSAPTMPTPGGVATNETGWAYWSGTSFAAPIITGLAARLWSADPTATPNALVRQIVDTLPSQPGATGLDDLFTPIITARQHWQ